MDDVVGAMFVFFLGGVMLITLYAFFKAVRRRYAAPSEKQGIPAKAEERLTQRLVELEKRISDTQEVMLAIDDKITLTQLPAAAEASRALPE